MSKSLKSMSPNQCQEVIQRRLRENKGGLGYWAARDAERKVREGANIMYEPMTIENGMGAAELKVCFNCWPGPNNEKCGYCDHFEAAIRRLHEYEKTGFSPGEIDQLLGGTKAK